MVLDIANGKFWFNNGEKSKFMHFANSEFLCALQGLTEMQTNELDALIGEFPAVFSDTIGKTDLVECKLQVEGPPIAQPP